MNYDVIVIGAGHNGLTTAALMAKARKRVLVLEKNGFIGGLGASEEICEGYRTAGFLHETAQISTNVVKELELESRGLQWVTSGQDTGVYVPGLNGEVGFWLYQDAVKTAQHLRERLGKKEGDAYARYSEFLADIRPVVQKMISSPLPDVSDLNLASLWQIGKHATRLRMLGKKNMLELLRVTPMCIADFLNEFFENEQLKAAISLPALAGTYMGPWSPGSTANLLMQTCGSNQRVVGGPWRFVKALEKSFLDFGGKILCHSHVTKIIVENGKATGVELASGEQIRADKIISSADPKTTFLGLMAPQELSHRFMNHVDHIRMRGTTAKVSLALNRPLKFKGNVSVEDVEYAIICGTVDDVEKAFDPVKYGELPTNPALQVYVPSLTSSDVAPEGHCVVSILVNFVPYGLREGWTAQSKEKLLNNVISVLETRAENVRANIVGSLVQSPLDLETEFSITGGQIHHGEHSLDQFISRPTPDTVDYSTPIPGLYVCGSGCFPGGGITGNPGYLAAKSIL